MHNVCSKNAGISVDAINVEIKPDTLLKTHKIVVYLRCFLVTSALHLYLSAENVYNIYIYINMGDAGRGMGDAHP
mgnify:CR=1 FL=1